MSEAIKKKEILNQKVKETHEASTAQIEQFAVCHSLELKFKETPQYKAFEKAIEKQKELLSEFNERKAELSPAALEYWNSDECDQSQGKKIPGGTIAVTKKHVSDEKKAIEWAKDNSPIMIKESIDKKLLKATATSQYDKGKGEITIPGYEITEETKFRVDSDLSKHVEAGGE